MTASNLPPTAAGPARPTPSSPRVGIPRHRLLLLFGGGLGLVIGTYTGLARAGIDHRFAPPEAHGIFMVLGFLGTLIALERAVAVGRRWAYAAPALSGASVLWLVSPLPRAGAGVLLAIAGGVVTATYAYLLRAGWHTHLAIMAVGALAWVSAALLWTAGMGPVRITPLLAAFLVLTVVGERLELSRLTLPGAASRRRFLVAVGVFAAGVAISVLPSGAHPVVTMRALGLVVAGIGMLGQVAWLLRYDVARRTVRREGLPRFAAICILAAYLWLTVSAVLWVAVGLGATGALLHDALVHALFLGFVFSMVMGHAPIIMPAVLRVPMHFLKLAYLPLVLLHLSVAVRVVADLAGSFLWREVALHGNVAALVLFVIVAVTSTRRGLRQAKGATP